LPLPFGGLIARRSYLSIETLAEAVCFAINKSLNGIYNLSDSEPISLSELARWYREGQGRSPHLFKLPEGILLAGSSMLGLHALAKLAIEPLPVSAEKLRNAGFVQTFTSSRQSIEAWAQSQS
jgi:UDP-glucose 4-epimerase